MAPPCIDIKRHSRNHIHISSSLLAEKNAFLLSPSETSSTYRSQIHNHNWYNSSSFFSDFLNTESAIFLRSSTLILESKQNRFCVCMRGESQYSSHNHNKKLSRLLLPKCQTPRLKSKNYTVQYRLLICIYVFHHKKAALVT